MSSANPPLFLFAHGAGAGSVSDWMLGWRQRLGTLGRVVAFDYPYMAAGKKRPDRLPVLIEAHRAALRAAVAGHEGPVFLAGKSMGSRVGCHLSLELESPVDGLICFGFPLSTLAKPPKIRRDVLVALHTPVLFLQGSRDRMSPLDVLKQVRGEMKAPSTLHVVPTGDHSLRWTKTALKNEGLTQEEADAQLLGVVASWVHERLQDAV